MPSQEILVKLKQKTKDTTLSMMVSIIFYFHTYLGKIPIFTNIFQMGWNHQLVFLIRPKWLIAVKPQQPSKPDDLETPKVGLLTKVAKTAAWTPQSLPGEPTKRCLKRSWLPKWLYKLEQVFQIIPSYT